MKTLHLSLIVLALALHTQAAIAGGGGVDDLCDGIKSTVYYSCTVAGIESENDTAIALDPKAAGFYSDILREGSELVLTGCHGKSIRGSIKTSTREYSTAGTNDRDAKMFTQMHGEGFSADDTYPKVNNVYFVWQPGNQAVKVTQSVYLSLNPWRVVNQSVATLICK